MGCRAQPVRYPISRTVQQMTRETRMGQPSYTEFRILPPGGAELLDHVRVMGDPKAKPYRQFLPTQDRSLGTTCRRSQTACLCLAHHNLAVTMQ